MKEPPELEWWGQGTIPAPASLVWCRFPNHLAPDVPGPKSRPGLVFKVRYLTDPPDGRAMVLVAYGTSKLKTGRRPHDFTIANAATLDVVRLPNATRFDLDQFVWMPWAKPWFMARDPQDARATPVITVLPDAIASQLRWTMAFRDANGLLAAYHGAKAVGEPPCDD